MLGTDGFVEIRPEDVKEEFEIIEEIEIEEGTNKYDWRKEMQIEVTKEDNI